MTYVCILFSFKSNFVILASNNEYMRPSMRTLTTLSQSSTAFECEDYPDLADCHLVATAGMCVKEQYRKLCCATCQQMSVNKTNDFATKGLS